MLFSGGACSRRVSLFLKPFSFPRRCAKLEREREELGVGRERENFVVVVLFCVECRGREERGKKDFKVFLGNEEKERIFFFLFFNFFSRDTNTKHTTGLIKKEKEREQNTTT